MLHNSFLDVLTRPLPTNYLTQSRSHLHPPHSRSTRKLSIVSSGAKDGSEVGRNTRRVRDQVGSFLLEYYLPVASLVTMVLGYLCPQPGVFLAQHNMTTVATIGVFITSGLLLDRGEAVKAFDSRGALLLGLFLILIGTPLVAPAMYRLPLQPAELSLGLAVFILSPTTLSSGVALIQAAGGNVAMALLLTLLSNFLAVFTMPLTLSLLLGFTNNGAVPLVLLRNLVYTVLLPTLGAYYIKSSIQGGEAWIKKRKKQVSYLGTAFLVSIPWMQVSRASLSGIPVNFVSLTLAVLLGLTTHILFLLTIQYLANSIKLGGKNFKEGVAIRRAVVLMSSQKSMTIALAALTQLSPLLGSEAVGIACIPCVLIHFGQTIIGAMLASYWAKSQPAS